MVPLCPPTFYKNHSLTRTPKLRAIRRVKMILATFPVPPDIPQPNYHRRKPFPLAERLSLSNESNTGIHALSSSAAASGAKYKKELLFPGRVPRVRNGGAPSSNPPDKRSRRKGEAETDIAEDGIARYDA